jgi:hypothetical protein
LVDHDQTQTQTTINIKYGIKLVELRIRRKVLKTPLPKRQSWNPSTYTLNVVESSQPQPTTRLDKFGILMMNPSTKVPGRAREWYMDMQNPEVDGPLGGSVIC